MFNDFKHFRKTVICNEKNQTNTSPSLCSDCLFSNILSLSSYLNALSISLNNDDSMVHVIFNYIIVLGGVCQDDALYQTVP